MECQKPVALPLESELERVLLLSSHDFFFTFLLSFYPFVFFAFKEFYVVLMDAALFAFVKEYLKNIRSLLRRHHKGVNQEFL